MPGRVIRSGGRVGVPERPGRLVVEKPAESPAPGDGDTRLLPPPTEPGIGYPIVPRLPPSRPDSTTPPANPGWDTSYPPPPLPWMPYGYNPYGGYGWYGYGYASCRMLPLVNEMDEFWARSLGWSLLYFGWPGYTWGMPMGWGCGFDPVFGYGYGYGSGYGYFGYATPALAALNTMPCAAVTAHTYSGHRYNILVMLPEFNAYGPSSLRLEILTRLKEDGEVVLYGRGSQELHLYAGFVRSVTTRWCAPGEW